MKSFKEFCTSCMIKKTLIGLFCALLIFCSYILFNTFTFPSKQITVAPVSPIAIPGSAKVHLSEAIQIPTISKEEISEMDSAAFYEFRAFVKNTYPLVDSLLEVTYINEFSIVIRWAGKNSSLRPAILMGHLDVVPVPEEEKSSWSANPFGGEIKEGIIWGRGAIDNKNSVIGTLEAAELLLGQGFQPERTIYLCYGHDEEIGGEYGAVAIVDHLRQKGVEAEYVLDEGFAITQGLVPGLSKDVALIGTAEKGFVTLQLSVELEGGHSSMPNKETAIDILSKAVVKLKDNPFPPEITQPVRDFMTYAGPEMPFIQKMAFANPAIFAPMIINTYEVQSSGNALVRTTTAPTIIKAGIKDNIIPKQATAKVNFRILPGTTIDEVKEHVIATVNDQRVRIKQSSFVSEVPKPSSVDSFGFLVINRTIKEVFPEVITTPNLVIGATDSRHYYPLSENVYRFTPFYLNQSNLKTFHGVDERISVTDFENAVRFYAQIMKNSSPQ